MPSTRPTRIASGADRPRLAPHVRLTYDPVRQRHVLLTPEAVSLLNPTGADVLRLCDGTRTFAAVVAELRQQYDGVDDDEVRAFLDRLADRRCVEVGRG